MGYGGEWGHPPSFGAQSVPFVPVLIPRESRTSGTGCHGGGDDSGGSPQPGVRVGVRSQTEGEEVP